MNNPAVEREEENTNISNQYLIAILQAVLQYAESKNEQFTVEYIQEILDKIDK